MLDDLYNSLPPAIQKVLLASWLLFLLLVAIGSFVGIIWGVITVFTQPQEGYSNHQLNQITYQIIRPTTEDTVQRIIDGDTVVLKENKRTRLIDCDAAELNTPKGVLQRDKLVKALPIGSTVEVYKEGFDTYGRTLAYVLYKNTSICNFIK